MTRRGRNSGNEHGITDDIRTEIVTRLAMFDKQHEILADLRERGVEISQQAISSYVPGNRRNLAKRWVELFHATREEYLREASAVPIANRVYRLRALERTLGMEMKRKNTVGIRATLEQAAKEVGGIYTNISKVQGAVLHATVPVEDMSTDEKRNMLADRLAEAARAMRKQQSTPSPETKH